MHASALLRLWSQSGGNSGPQPLVTLAPETRGGLETAGRTNFPKTPGACVDFDILNPKGGYPLPASFQPRSTRRASVRWPYTILDRGAGPKHWSRSQHRIRVLSGHRGSLRYSHGRHLGLARLADSFSGLARPAVAPVKFEVHAHQREHALMNAAELEADWFR